MSLNTFSRRRVLRAATLVPLARYLSASRPAKAGAVGNFIFFHTPNGFQRETFGADGMDASFALRSSLAALTPHRGDISVVTGLCNKSTSATTGASQVCRLLTCQSGDEPTLAYGESLDQRIGRLLGGASLNLLAMGSPAQQWQEHLSWTAALKPASNAVYPDAVWNDAFGQSPAFSVDAGAKENLVLSYLNSLAGRTYGRLPRSEKDRLEPHLQALRDLKARQMQAPACTAPPLTLAQLKALPQDGSAGNLEKHGRAKIDVLLAAFACGTRRAATFMWQGAGPGALNPISGARDHYEVSLRKDADAKLQRSQIDAWYAAQFAYLLEGLKTRKLLDQTIVVWGSEVAEGQHHNNMTFVLAGGRSLGLRQQVTLNVPFSGDEKVGRPTAWLPTNRPVSDLWQTVLKALGMNTEEFAEKDFRGVSLSGLLG